MVLKCNTVALEFVIVLKFLLPIKKWMLNNNVVKTDDKTQFMIVEAQQYKGERHRSMFTT